MLRVLKRIGILLVVGAILGDVAVLLMAPSAITWFQTPGTGQALCNCKDLAQQTAASFVHSQLIGMAVGAGGMLVVGELVRHFWLRRKQRKAAAAAPAAPRPS
jgi:hypothetical protein